MNTLGTNQWLELAQRQHERAMAGDQQAAAWCAKHAPALGAAAGWQAHNALWDKFQRLHRSYERLSLTHRGYEKLYWGHWKEGCPEYFAWVEELSAAWASPEAKADYNDAIAKFDSWTDAQQSDFAESFGDFLVALASSHGLDATKLANEEQAARLLDSFPRGTFKETCIEIAAEIAACVTPL